MLRVGLGEQQVQADAARAIGGHTAQQLGVQRPPPGPPTDRRHAGLVDRDDHDVLGRRLAHVGPGVVLQHAVEARHRLRQGQQRDQRDQAGGQQQPGQAVQQHLAQAAAPARGSRRTRRRPAMDGHGDAQGRPTGRPSLAPSVPPSSVRTTGPMWTRRAGEKGPTRPDASRACRRTW
jgi:hypothetical protein